jgi:hypothetical protein
LEDPVDVPQLPLQPNDEQQLQHQNRRRFTTEELSRWVSKFTKAKIASRKQQDLRRQVLLHNALIFAKSEIAGVQKERMQRWRELKPLFHLETTPLNPVTRRQDQPDKMAVACDKMAADPYQMADESEDMDQAEPRPATPLPSVAAFKRNRCGCSSAFTYCQCRKDASRISKKFRPSSPEEDDEDLKSLDQFLSSLHCNSRQVVDWESIYSYQMCPTD